MLPRGPASARESPKRSFRLENAVFALCVVAGAAVLIVSTWLMGEPKFRESNKHFYFFCLFATGLAAGAVAPRSWWTCWAAIYLGQSIAYALTPTPHPSAFWGLGFFFLLFFSLVSLPGAVIGARGSRLGV